MQRCCDNRLSVVKGYTHQSPRHECRNKFRPQHMCVSVFGTLPPLPIPDLTFLYIYNVHTDHLPVFATWRT